MSMHQQTATKAEWNMAREAVEGGVRPVRDMVKRWFEMRGLSDLFMDAFKPSLRADLNETYPFAKVLVRIRKTGDSQEKVERAGGRDGLVPTFWRAKDADQDTTWLDTPTVLVWWAWGVVEWTVM